MPAPPRPTRTTDGGDVIVVGPLQIDRRSRRVHLDGDELTLTAKEFDVLAYLAAEPGAVFSRTEILERVWDVNWYGPTKTVDAHVAALRKQARRPPLDRGGARRRVPARGRLR